MLVMLLSKYKNKNYPKIKLQGIALKIEREKISGGKQDQYTGLFGGFNLLKFKNGYKCNL